MLDSRHVDFLREASRYGDLYVGVCSDTAAEALRGMKPVCPEQERLYMVRAIRHVRDASIISDVGTQDFTGMLDEIRPDVLVVSPAEDSAGKRRLCEERGIGYVVSGGAAGSGGEPGTPGCSSSGTDTGCRLPYRVDIAGTWIDQPYVSRYGAGWALTVSIEPTVEFMERGGMSTSTRNAAKKIWPHRLPAMDEETLARLLFCFENDPEDREHVSGAQDAIGICMAGLTRHRYDGRYWPGRIESCHEEKVLSWLESHLMLLPMFPRRPGCSVVEGMDITPAKVKALTEAADRCWDAIMAMDFDAFAKAFRDSFEAQVSMFPAMMQPGVEEYIGSVRDKVPAWKMLGAGGGGHLALVVPDGFRPAEGMIPIRIRRKGY